MKVTDTACTHFFCSGLKFTQIALTRSQADKAEELSESFTKAYGETLKKYHSFVVKPVFAVRLPCLLLVPFPFPLHLLTDSLLRLHSSR